MKRLFKSLGRHRLILALALSAAGHFLASKSLAQTFVPPTMTGTPAPGSYYNNTGVRLVAPFSFTSHLDQSLRVYTVNYDCLPVSAKLSPGMNYVSVMQPRVGGYTDAGPLLNANTCDFMQMVQYFDGIGRPIQAVQIKGNPDATKDLIMPRAYDALGRESVRYLPYATSTDSAGKYQSAALKGSSGYSNSGQKTFYGISGQNYKEISTPFAVTGFEPSPLNRVVEQGAPGDPWQIYSGSISGSGHTQKMAYLANNDTTLTDTAHTRRVALYTATINASGSRTLARAGANTAIYPANQLSVTVFKNENWTSGRAGTTEEYKDKEGHMVLKRTFNYKNGALEMLSTYYVYDDQNNLAYVLPPAARPDSLWLPNQATLNNLCYQYRYDQRSRLTQKKLPGKGWDMMVYNKLDQMVFSQDSVQRLSHQWTVTKYDAFDRIVITGLWNAGSSIPQATLQASVYAAPQFDERDYASTTTGYTISSYPSTIDHLLTIDYYDDYSFPNLPPAYASTSYSTMTRGLATASKTAILNPNGTVSSDMLWNVRYYDDYGRNVKSYFQHFLGGTYSANNYDEVASAYDFTNAVTGTTRLHHTAAASGSATLSVADSYTYDHLGRKVLTWNKINSGANVLLSKLDYNEVGQLYKKYLHSANGGSSFLQNVAYGYNERGWMKTANSSTNLFNMELKYNDGSMPQFNGNIANQVWTTQGQSQQTYSYVYDNLNRLTEGKSGSYAERGITYDAMGNIKTLSRVYNSTLIDSLSYNYLVTSNPTNQVQSISDKSADAGTVGYKAGTNWAYAYDGNGNMTSDNSKGLSVTYNLLNLPKVNTLTGGTISYTYDATGQKLRKVSTLGGGATTEYIGGIQYDGTTVSFLQTSEGRVLSPTSSPDYEYTLSDHLGNSRVNFDTATGIAQLSQSDDYLPFGMAVQLSSTSPKNNYLYNSKELQEGLGLYDYGARFYDPVIGRWTSVDPLAEGSRRWSPFTYGKNNPITTIDPDGMWDWVIGGSAGSQPVWDDNVHNNADAERLYGEGATDVTKDGATFNYTHGGRGVVLNPNGSWDYTFSEMTQELPTGNGFEVLQSNIRSMGPLLTTASITAEVTANLAVGALSAVESGANMAINGVARRAEFLKGFGSEFEQAVKSTVELGGKTIKNLLGWGTSNDTADVIQTLQRTENLGSNDIQAMKLGGVTKEWLIKQLRYYNGAIRKAGDKLTNTQLLPRKALMEKILQLWE